MLGAVIPRPDRAPRPITLALSVLLAAGCRETTATQIVVYVDTDMTVPTEMDGFRVRVLEGADALVHEQAFGLEGAAAIELPASFGVAPRGGDGERHVRVEADATRGDPPHVVVTTAAETGFVREEALRLDLFLARRCKDVSCSAREACRPTGCEPVEIDPGDLPDDGSDVPMPTGCVPQGRLDTWEAYRTVTGLARLGDALLVADIGFRSFDLADSGRLSVRDFGANTNDVVARGNAALVIDVLGMSLLFDVDTWVHPTGTFREALLDGAFVSDDLVAAAGSDRVSIFDPVEPDVIVGEVGSILSFYIAAADSLVFTTWGDLLTVVDAGDPANPRVVGSTDLTGGCGGGRGRVAAAADAAFVCCSTSGLLIVSALDPGQPRVVSIADWPAVDVQVRGPYAFVAAGDEGLVVLDVTDLAAPAFVASFPVSGTGTATAVFVDDDGRAYVGTAEGNGVPGMVDVFDVSCFGAP